MLTAKQLRQRLAEKIQKARDVIELAETENRERTAEDNETIARIHAEAGEIQKQITALEEQERFETGMAQFRERDAELGITQPIGGDGDTLPRDHLSGEALRGWVLNQLGMPDCMTPDIQDAMSQQGVMGTNDTLNTRLPSFMHVPTGWTQAKDILNALSVGSDTAGGYTVSEGFIRALEVALLQFGGMRRVSTIIRTTTAETLPYPTTDDTSNTGELLEENQATSTTGTDVAFGVVNLNAYMYTSKLVRVSEALMRDSAFDIPSLLGRVLGERLGRIQNTHLTTGDAASKPKGIVTAATLGRTTAAAGAVTADDFIRLIHSVDPAYRSNPSVAFMMHDSIYLEACLLKDGNNNYLVRENVDAAFTGAPPARIRGYNVVINQDMASSLTTEYKTVLFGDFAKYMIREVGRLQMKRMTERFGEYFQTGFIGAMWFDGNLIDAGTHPVKYIQQA